MNLSFSSWFWRWAVVQASWLTWVILFRCLSTVHCFLLGHIREYIPPSCKSILWRLRKIGLHGYNVDYFNADISTRREHLSVMSLASQICGHILYWATVILFLFFFFFWFDKSPIMNPFFYFWALCLIKKTVWTFYWILLTIVTFLLCMNSDFGMYDRTFTVRFFLTLIIKLFFF